jgi:endonuclease YncB( thermonuclease family)
MPFTLIAGSFRLLNQTAAGNIAGFQPDGDSIHFKADNLALMQGLKQIGQPLRPTNIGSVNLRLEGIDALELHYNAGSGGETRQPAPLAEAARNLLTQTLGLDPVQYVPPKGLAVKPPAPNDGARGYILSRSLETHGRPVSFVFSGAPPAADGAAVNLDPVWLRQSFNYKVLLQGLAYPLFYDTLFGELRAAMARAVRYARGNQRGVWPADLSRTGLTATAIADLEANGVIFPKLFRRLANYFAAGHNDLSQFLRSGELGGEQVLDLNVNSPMSVNFTHFDNMLQVNGNTVSLRQDPETMVFVSAK